MFLIRLFEKWKLTISNGIDSNSSIEICIIDDE